MNNPRTSAKNPFQFTYAEPAAPPIPVSRVDPHKITILLVDDDPAVREGLTRVLRSEGWSVIPVANGEAALVQLEQRQPHVLITDLSMVGINGWDLLFHEKLQRPDLPIFVITALPQPNIGGADLFAHEFFQKPIDLDALIAAVYRYVERPAPRLEKKRL